MDAVATAFGTSHMPVREALRRLVAENALVVLRKHGSAMVPMVNRGQLADLFRLRVVIERSAVEQAVVYRTETDLDLLGQLAQRHRDIAVTGNADAMLELNQQFHFRLYECAQSAVTTRLIEVLWLSMGPYMRLLSQAVDRQMRTGDSVYAGTHDDIITGLRTRDATFAGDAIASDIRSTQRLLSKVLTDAEALHRDGEY